MKNSFIRCHFQIVLMLELVALSISAHRTSLRTEGCRLPIYFLSASYLPDSHFTIMAPGVHTGYIIFQSPFRTAGAE